MALPALPSGMIPLSNNYTYSYAGGVVGSKVGGGSTRYALGYDRGRGVHQVTLMLSPTQVPAWNIFFHHTIKKGSLPFTMELDSGAGCMSHTCYIIPDSVSAARVNDLYTSVSFQVEAENYLYSMSSEVLDALSVWVIAGAEVGLTDIQYINAWSQLATVDSNVLQF